MLRFIFRRSAYILLVGVAIVFFSHLGMRMAPNSSRTPNFDFVTHSLAAWQDTRGFFTMLRVWDFGFLDTQAGPLPVAGFLLDTFRNSLGLLLLALTGATIAGVMTGFSAALVRHRRLALPLLILTIIGISTPSFVVGLLLQMCELRFLQSFGRPLVSIAGYGWDFQHLMLPVLVLATRPLAYITRATFLALDHVMGQDYIRTAYAKGLSRRRTVDVHAVRNIAVPVLTSIGVSMRFSLGSLPVVETFFAWPGAGLRMLEAIRSQQTTLVAALALAFGFVFMTVNLLLELIYQLVDPRLRETGT